MKPPSRFNVGELKNFSGAFDKLKAQGLLTPALSADQLKQVLDSEQRKIVDQIFELDPEDYGVHTPYVGLEPVPDDLVTVSGQEYIENSETKALSDKLVPRPVYDAYVHMKNAFIAENPGRGLLIGSAYRSPAYQVVTFIGWCLNAYGGDIAKTIRHASPPAYSQHTIASRTALDLMNIDGLPGEKHPELFKTTLEYDWLRRNAARYGFHESWQEGNEFGMRAEPWHWQFLGQGVV